MAFGCGGKLRPEFFDEFGGRQIVHHIIVTPLEFLRIGAAHEIQKLGKSSAASVEQGHPVALF